MLKSIMKRKKTPSICHMEYIYIYTKCNNIKTVWHGYSLNSGYSGSEWPQA